MSTTKQSLSAAAGAKLAAYTKPQKKHLAFGLAMGVLGVFAMGALGSPDWTSWELKAGGFEIEWSAGLWEYAQEGDVQDDGGKVEAKVDGRKFRNFKAYELNRFTTFFAFLSLAAMAVYQIAAGCLGLEKYAAPVGYASAALLFVLGFLLIVGAGYFGTRMEENPYVDDPDEVAHCDHGCGLAALTGVLAFLLGFALLYATLATDERAEKIHDSAVVQDMEAGIKKLKAGVGKKMTKLRGSSKAPAPDGPPAAYATAAATEAEAAETPAAETPAAEP